MLVLIQIEVVGGGEHVDLLIDGIQTIPQCQVSLGLGNGLACIARGAITDGPLAHIPIGGGAEPLELLDQADRVLTVVQIRGSLGVDRSQGKQTDDEHQGHHQAYKLSLHNDILLYEFLMELL